MVRFYGIIVFCLLSSLSFAAGLDDFKKRFQFVRDGKGQLVEVRDRSMTTHISLKDFVVRLKEWVKASRSTLRSEDIDGRVDFMLEGFSDDELVMESLIGERVNLRSVLKKSLRAVANRPVEHLFERSELSRVLKDFEQNLKANFRLLGLNVVARPYDMDFFYKRAVSYKIVTIAIDMAKRTLSDVPLFNLAVFVITNYERLVRTRRHYHQNMLLHYLEHSSPEDLELSQEEWRSTLSSIYESRIEWTGFKEIKEAKGDWKGYGVKKFHARWRTGTRVLLANEEHYDSFGLRLNFAFQEAVLDGERVILNVVDKAHLFSGKPSVAFYYASPRKVRNKRILFQAAQMGILFVPVSGFIKNTVGEFLKSFYRQQALTEGALAAHFAMTGEGKIKDGILHQAINPFLVW